MAGRNRKTLLFSFLAVPALLLTLASTLPAETIKRNGPGEEKLFSIEVREADISDVLRALAQQSGLNIVLGDGVEGKISLSFKNIPFRDALEMIIRSRGLMYSTQNNVFWVGKKVDISEEMRMEVLRLNNADPAAAAPQVKVFLSPDGSVNSDARTNSLIIRDLPRNIEKAKALLKDIDIQTPQVVIEARIVEATSSFSRQLGIQWGPTYTSGKSQVTGSQLLSTSSGERNFAVNLPAANPTAGLGIILGNISNKLFLDLELTAAETRGELKIISRPRISTLNNKPATIHSGLTFRVKLSQAIVTGAGTTTTTSGTGLEEIKTGIDLTVTPQISTDGFIMLNINTNKSDPDFSHTVDGIPGVTEKSASTNVMIKDGDTVVIGGLYRSSTSKQDNSVPFLSELPVLGYLFKSKSNNVENEELIVFITPKIIRFDKPMEVLN